ncbi:tail fiber assembly protein [Yersinia enterocolitica]
MIYFSAITKGFYPTDVIDKEWYEKHGNWPTDVTKISRSDYEKYLSTPPMGMELGSKNGKPAWVEVEISKERYIIIATMEKQQLMVVAEEAIAPLLRAVKFDMATDEEKALLEAWERYSVLLSRIDVRSAPDIKWPLTPKA